MTQVHFYSQLNDYLKGVCQTLRELYKAQIQGTQKRVLILCRHHEQMQQLETMLWTFAQLEFIPHVSIDSTLAKHTPVVLAYEQAAPPSYAEYEMLFNLTSTAKTEHPFAAIYEFVGPDETDKAEGRERYKQYQKLGYALEHHISGDANAQ